MRAASLTDLGQRPKPRFRNGLPTPDRATAVSVLYTVCGVAPLFLATAQAVAIQRDLGFGTAGLGIAVAACFVGSALGAPLLGRLVAIVGARAGLRLSASFSLAALLTMALAASRWWHLALALVLSGLADAAAQVSTNLTLFERVRRAAHGLAFGAKQAAVPLASLAIGVAVPLVGTVAGWRLAFGLAALGALALVLRPPAVGPPASAAAALPAEAAAPVAAALPARAASIAADAGAPDALAPDRSGGRPPRRVMALMAATGVLAGTAGNSLPAFAVDAGVDAGFGEAAAAALLAVGSAIAVCARIGAGVLVDRRRGNGMTELAVLIGAAAGCFALLGLASDSRLLFAAILVPGFAAAWGWPGLIYYAAVHVRHANAAVTSGIVLSSVYVGNMAGPVIVGLIAEHRSYAAAWTVCAAIAAAAAVTAATASRVTRWD